MSTPRTTRIVHLALGTAAVCASLVVQGCTGAPAGPPSRTPQPSAVRTSWTPSPSAAPSATPTTAPSETPTTAPDAPATTAPATTSAPRPTTQAPAPARTITATTIGFGSPTGNIVCVMSSTKGVDCHIMKATWPASSVPRSRQLHCGTDESGFGPFSNEQEIVLKSDGAWGMCVSEIHTLEAYLSTPDGANTFGAEYRAWFDPERDKAVEVAEGARVPVLPYGGRATAGRYTCTMATTGVTCTNTRTKAGFTLSRARLTLR